MKNQTSTYQPSRSKRPGITAKTKHSSNKSSKNYQKQYRGQGR